MRDVGVRARGSRTARNFRHGTRYYGVTWARQGTEPPETGDQAVNAEELRTLQAPLKAQYQRDPGSAVITLHAEGALDGDGVACRVDTGRALVEAGLHPATGGTGLQACSGDMLLEALVACAGVTLRAVATALGITLRGGLVKAEGDLDFRGTLGVAKDAPVGFKNIRLTFDLQADATPEQLQTLQKLTERYCVVYQTLRQPPPVAVSFAPAIAEARD